MQEDADFPEMPVPEKFPPDCDLAPVNKKPKPLVTVAALAVTLPVVDAVNKDVEVKGHDAVKAVWPKVIEFISINPTRNK